MTIESDLATPGQLLSELLEARGWSQQTLSIVLRVDNAVITRIIAGKKPLTADLALALGEVFDVEPGRLLDLQKKYELAQARLVARPDPGRAQRARLFGELPITHMIKRGWLPGAESTRDVPKVEAALTRFFGTADASKIAELPHAARKTDALEAPTLAQLAWLTRVRSIAAEMIVAPFSSAKLHAALPKLSSLLAAAEEARHVPRILAEAGVRFVLVESLQGAKIDGVCTWLREGEPIIGLTCRHDRIDNFFFVLRHEIEHALQGHGRGEVTTVDVELEGARAGTGEGVSEEERVANAAAAEFCVSQAMMKRFIDRKAPFFAERDLIGFAKTIKVHPGLVAGQLQHKTGRYDRFRAHQVKIRSIVAPSAIVDGWGDVAPLEV